MRNELVKWSLRPLTARKRNTANNENSRNSGCTDLRSGELARGENMLNRRLFVRVRHATPSGLTGPFEQTNTDCSQKQESNSSALRRSLHMTKSPAENRTRHSKKNEQVCFCHFDSASTLAYVAYSDDAAQVNVTITEQSSSIQLLLKKHS